MNEIGSEGEVRGFVRQRYGEIARDALQGKATGCGPGCCSPGDTDAEALIPLQAVAENHSGAINLSLGCGDPLLLAELLPGQTVLDLGSGAGLDCFNAARQVGKEGRVIGVDMTVEMLSLARTNQSRLGLENVEFRLGEIEHLPVADGSVDVVISNCVINLSPDKPQVLREAWRVLKPGGRLAISDIATQGTLPQDLRSDLSSWASCVAGALEVQEYRAMLEAVGFVNIQIEPAFVYAEVQEPDGASPKQSEDAGEKPKIRVYSVRVRAQKP